MYFDNLLRYIHVPHKNILPSEAYVTFDVNKTAEWLKDKPDDEAETLVASARKENGDLRQNLKKRVAIIVNRSDKIEEDRHQKELAANKKLKLQDDLNNQILYFGLWQSDSQVDNIHVLATIESKQEKRKALKTQLKFRKEIFQQKHDHKTVNLFF